MIRRIILLITLTFLAACASTTGGSTGIKKGERITVNDLDNTDKLNYQLGLDYIRSANYDVAEEKLMKIVTNNPNFPDVYNALGVLQERRGKITDATVFFAKAVSLDPYYEIAMTNYNRLQCRVGNAQSLANIAKDAQATLQAGLYSGAAECANYYQQYNEALIYADSAIVADTKYPDAYFQKAKALSSLGRYNEVLSTLDLYHDLKGYTVESVILGEQASRLSNDTERANRYKYALETQFSRN